jgi:hypothetical protein
MKASIVDLRYKMNEVLKALDRNEKVKILYHGKVKGIISPLRNEGDKKVRDHPFFGMSKDIKISVSEEMNKLRGLRYNVI